MKRIALLVLLSLFAIGCKRAKAPAAKHIWLGPNGGCISTAPHPQTGELACWGALPGDKTPAEFAAKRDFAPGALSDFSISATQACAVHDGHEVYCWTAEQPTPVRLPDEGDKLAVKVGARHTCVRTGDTLRCFGDDAQGQLGKPEDWNRNAKLRAFALGSAHTCAAYENAGVVCRGQAVNADALSKLDVIGLTAGDAHTCALLSNHTVRCWGKNGSGQLGDQTMNDAESPVAVLGIQQVAQIAAGAHHTCALVGNGTVHCWGDNAHHQLANGEIKNSGRAAMVLGALGIAEVAAAGDGTCVRFFSDGEVRCWGRNDAAQLGDGSRVEHTVPASMKYH